MPFATCIVRWFTSVRRRLSSWLLLRRAAHCARRRKHDRVLQLCNRALELAPCSAWAYALRGNALCEKGELEPDISASTEAVRLRPKLGYAYNARGAAHYRLGKFNEALADFDAAIRAAPRVAVYRANRGAARRELNDLQGALHDLLRAYKMKSSSALIRLELAKCYLSIGEDNRALYLLRIVIREDPKAAAAYYFRALIHAGRRNYASAAADFDRAARLEPRWSLIFVQRALNHLRLSRPQEAMADVERAWQLSASVDALLVRAEVYGALADHTKALADLDEAIRLDPKCASAYGNRGLQHAKLGNLDRALADSERSLELEPTCAVFYNNRGFIRQARGEFRLAVADYQSAMRLDPKHPNAYKNLAMLRATCRDREFRNGSEAIELVERALELSQYSEPAWCEIMANAQAEAGHFTEATEWLRRAGERPPSSQIATSSDELPRQFTLSGLLYATTVIAAVLGASQWLGIGELAIDPSNAEDGIFEAAICILLTGGVTLLLWRAYRASDGKRRAFCAGAACALPVGFCLLAWSSIASCLPLWIELARSELPSRRWLWWATVYQELTGVISALGVDAAIALVLYVPLGGAIGVALFWAGKWVRLVRLRSVPTRILD